MLQSEIFNTHLEDYEAWYEAHQDIYMSEVAAIQEHLQKLPENIRGIEVGLGTGRFSAPLGIKEGVEPASALAQRAAKRGIESIKGTAERLPYSDLSFDFVLFVTICHLHNLQLALSEANRVLKRGGAIIIGFLDKDQKIAAHYEQKRDRSTFYKHAKFYTVKRISQLLLENGFKQLEFNQTLFGAFDEIAEIQFPKPGHGAGSFVVVRAIKK